MDPYAAHYALGVLESHTITPVGEQERISVRRSFAVLEELATLYRAATEETSAPTI
ncbi:hypothetical protein ABZ622_13900 [Streptomyces sp. NPDC007164]|uniref:hypothetical protein n=1 Tax=Streptomyces sp. NPDC007164 TaxID=3156918 RepID=UPI0033F5422F